MPINNDSSNPDINKINVSNNTNTSATSKNQVAPGKMEGHEVKFVDTKNISWATKIAIFFRGVSLPEKHKYIGIRDNHNKLQYVNIGALKNALAEAGHTRKSGETTMMKLNDLKEKYFLVVDNKITIRPKIDPKIAQATSTFMAQHRGELGGGNIVTREVSKKLIKENKKESITPTRNEAKFSPNIGPLAAHILKEYTESAAIIEELSPEILSQYRAPPENDEAPPPPYSPPSDYNAPPPPYFPPSDYDAPPPPYFSPSGPASSSPNSQEGVNSNQDANAAQQSPRAAEEEENRTS